MGAWRRKPKLHWGGRRRYSTARNTAKSALATAAPTQEAQGADQLVLVSSSCSSLGSKTECGPGLPAMMLTLGSSATCNPKDLYSFSSGPWLGSEAKELLGLMARSAEQMEHGWPSCQDSSWLGLLISDGKCGLPELLFGQGELPPIVAVGAGVSGVSFSVWLLLSDSKVLASASVDTLDGVMPMCVGLTGSWDGAGWMGTLAPGNSELVGTVESTVLTGTGLAGTLEVTVLTGSRVAGEGTELVLTEVVGTSGGTSLGQVEALAWLPAAPAEGKLMEEGEEKEGLTDMGDTVGPGKWLALGVERAKGWKETVGDTGPRGDVRLETGPCVLPSSAFCS